jgi:hypothetical protein
MPSRDGTRTKTGYTRSLGRLQRCLSILVTEISTAYIYSGNPHGPALTFPSFVCIGQSIKRQSVHCPKIAVLVAVILGPLEPQSYRNYTITSAQPLTPLLSTETRPLSGPSPESPRAGRTTRYPGLWWTASIARYKRPFVSPRAAGSSGLSFPVATKPNLGARPGRRALGVRCSSAHHIPSRQLAARILPSIRHETGL